MIGVSECPGVLELLPQNVQVIDVDAQFCNAVCTVLGRRLVAG